MISQFFVLSPRGDTIICQNYRGDVTRGTPEIFYRKVKFWKGEAPPIFVMDGVSFLHIKKSGLYFVATTRLNVSPNVVLELLVRLTKVFKDYCGVLSEESIRKNFVLIYELLDEIMDSGWPQGTSTEQLKLHVHTVPLEVEQPVGKMKFPEMAANSRTTPSSAVHKPITMGSERGGGKQKNEIFVDILERITILFNNNGYILNSEIDGCIQMKSYLSGNPELRLALNEEICVGRQNSQYGSLVLDDCNFHECVQLKDFDTEKCISFFPPDGEFAVMNYRITGDFRVPFRIFPFVEESGGYKYEVVIKVRADIPEQNYSSNVVVKLPVPKCATGVTTEMQAGVPGHTTEFKASQKLLLWSIKKFQGGAEHTLRAKITLGSQAGPGVRKEIGPIAVNFETPMHNVSGLQVRYLRIMEKQKSYNPYRWVRYVTQSNSYVCRV